MDFTGRNAWSGGWGDSPGLLACKRPRVPSPVSHNNVGREAGKEAILCTGLEVACGNGRRERKRQRAPIIPQNITSVKVEDITNILKSVEKGGMGE
jgi:hypothetical protein